MSPGQQSLAQAGCLQPNTHAHALHALEHLKRDLWLTSEAKKHEKLVGNACDHFESNEKMLRGIFDAKSYLRTALGLYLSHLHMGADTACPLSCPYAWL